MYKALHVHSGEEILTLGPAWRGRNIELRAFTQQDLLVCQGCRQPVRLKAGPRKRPHFAHKHLQGCSYGGDSPRLLAARALLFDALSARFPGQVDVEWMPEGAGLPRPVDCLVRAQPAPFAFWLVDSYLKLEARQQIHAAFASLGIPVTWVLLSGMLRPDPNHPAWTLLSPTERGFLCQTAYDEIGRERQLLEGAFGSTLHYLDEESGVLLTLRSLERVHPPNVFSGRREECPLEQVELSAQGEFVYPGEERALSASRSQRLRQVERVRRWLEPPRKPAPELPGLIPAPPVPPPAPQAAHADKVTCIFCGAWTDNWWASWVEDGERLGKCRDCLERGLG
jgi:hypothetical protein